MSAAKLIVGCLRTTSHEKVLNYFRLTQGCSAKIRSVGTHANTSHFQQHVNLIFKSVFNEVFTFIALRTKTWTSVQEFLPHYNPGIAPWHLRRQYPNLLAIHNTLFGTCPSLQSAHGPKFFKNQCYSYRHVKLSIYIIQFFHKGWKLWDSLPTAFFCFAFSSATL